MRRTTARRMGERAGLGGGGICDPQEARGRRVCIPHTRRARCACGRGGYLVTRIPPTGDRLATDIRIPAAMGKYMRRSGAPSSALRQFKGPTHGYGVSRRAEWRPRGKPGRMRPAPNSTRRLGSRIPRGRYICAPRGEVTMIARRSRKDTAPPP